MWPSLKPSQSGLVPSSSIGNRITSNSSTPTKTMSRVPLHMLPGMSLRTPSIRFISTMPPEPNPPSPEPNPPFQEPRPSSSNLPAFPSSLPHLNSRSEIHLISTSRKKPTHRRALAVGHVRFSNSEPLRLIREHSLKKGDILAVARIAGIQAVKRTSDIIPLAHSGIGVEGCIVKVQPVSASPGRNDDTESKDTNHLGNANEGIEATENDSSLIKVAQPQRQSCYKAIGDFGGVRLSVSVETTAKTGVEMEALTGVMGAALTVVDMCKGVDKRCVIEGVKVLGKTGGRSGRWGVYAERSGSIDPMDKESQTDKGNEVVSTGYTVLSAENDDRYNI